MDRQRTILIYVTVNVFPSACLSPSQAPSYGSHDCSPRYVGSNNGRCTQSNTAHPCPDNGTPSTGTKRRGTSDICKVGFRRLTAKFRYVSRLVTTGYRWLEPCAVKVARTVLRRGGGSNPFSLFDLNVNCGH